MIIATKFCTYQNSWDYEGKFGRTDVLKHQDIMKEVGIIDYGTEYAL